MNLLKYFPIIISILAKKTLYIIIIYIATLELGFSQQSSPVEVDAVIMSDLNQSIPLIGRVRALKEAKVSSSTGGLIEQILVKEGDRIKKNQIIAIVDKSKYEWLLNISQSKEREAELELKSVQLEIIMNNIEINRINSLKNSSVFNLAKFEKLQNNKESLLVKEKIAGIKLNMSKNQSNIAKLDFARSKIKAPFDGVIETRYVETGEVINIGSPIIKLVSTSSLEIHSDIPSNRARVLIPGNEVKIKTSDEIYFVSKVRAIGVRENSSTRTIPIYLEFINSLPSRKLNIGENLSIFIPIGPGVKALTVHKDAILKREGMSFVYIVLDKIVQIRPVKLGDGISDRFKVLNGLQEGDLVVIKGNERLRPNQNVTIIPNK